MNSCPKFAIWPNNPIKGLPECLAPFDGRGNFRSMDDAIFRAQLRYRLITPSVYHFGEIASGNRLVCLRVHSRSSLIDQHLHLRNRQWASLRPSSLDFAVHIRQALLDKAGFRFTRVVSTAQSVLALP